MKRTQHHPAERQLAALEDISKATGPGVAELIRRAADAFFLTNAKGDK